MPHVPILYQPTTDPAAAKAEIARLEAASAQLDVDETDMKQKANEKYQGMKSTYYDEKERLKMEVLLAKRALKQLLQASYEGTGPAVAALTSGAGATPIDEAATLRDEAIAALLERPASATALLWQVTPRPGRARETVAAAPRRPRSPASAAPRPAPREE